MSRLRHRGRGEGLLEVGLGRGRLLGGLRSRSLGGWRGCCGGRWKVSCCLYRGGVQEIWSVAFDRFVDFDVLDFWSGVVCFRGGCCVGGGGDGAVAILIASPNSVNVFDDVSSALCAPCRLGGLHLSVVVDVPAHPDYCDASPFSHRRLSPVYSVSPVQTICPSIYPLVHHPFVSSCRRHHRAHSQRLLCLALHRFQVLSIALSSRPFLSLVMRRYGCPHF
jgi:hypothetical protein